MLRLLGATVLFLLWNTAVSVFALILPFQAGLNQLLGLAAGVAVTGWYLESGLVRRGRPGQLERHRLLRLRLPGRAATGWISLSIPVFIALSWALGELYLTLVPVPPGGFNPFAPMMDDAVGIFSVAVLAVGLAPLVEELFFRGMLQGTIERRWGVPVAVAMAALAFALAHLGGYPPQVAPLYVFLGLAFGVAVVAARSIWAGVALHAANNTAALVGFAVVPDTVSYSTVWEAGLSTRWWSNLALLAVSGAGFVWTLRKLAQAARRPSCGAPPRRPLADQP